jgi:arginyl-tRNA synthetase
VDAILEEIVLLVLTKALDRSVVVELSVERFWPSIDETVLKDPDVKLDKAPMLVEIVENALRDVLDKVPTLVEIVEKALRDTLDKLPILVDRVDAVGRKRRIILEIVETLIAVCVLSELTDAFMVLERVLVAVERVEKTERSPDVLT